VIFSFVRVHGGAALPAGNNATHDWVHLIGVIPQKGSNGSEALRDPGAFVKQVGSFAKGRKINFESLAAELLDYPHRFRVQSLGFFVAEELELFHSRHAEPEGHIPPRRGVFAGARFTRKGIAGIKTLSRVPDHVRHLASGRQDGDAIERAASGDHARGAEQASRRFQANQIVERRRHAARTRRICTEGKRH
jgi:hypothetical protein